MPVKADVSPRDYFSKIIRGVPRLVTLCGVGGRAYNVFPKIVDLFCPNMISQEARRKESAMETFCRDIDAHNNPRLFDDIVCFQCEKPIFEGHSPLYVWNEWLTKRRSMTMFGDNEQQAVKNLFDRKRAIVLFLSDHYGTLMGEGGWSHTKMIYYIRPFDKRGGFYLAYNHQVGDVDPGGLRQRRISIKEIVREVLGELGNETALKNMLPKIKQAIDLQTTNLTGSPF